MKEIVSNMTKKRNKNLFSIDQCYKVVKINVLTSVYCDNDYETAQIDFMHTCLKNDIGVPFVCLLISRNHQTQS